MKDSIAIPIADSSQAGEARRAAVVLANQLGFKETERGKVAIVVTEIANNLVQHTRGGVLLLRAIEQPTAIGIEILALDQGPGMLDVDECLQDGFSTAGTSGTGLGAVVASPDFLEIYSIKGQGTALLAHLWLDPASYLAEKILELGVVCLPKFGQEVSGDAGVAALSLLAVCC